MAKWRLILDPPYDFAVENGYALNKLAPSFRKSAGIGDEDTTFREPATGLLMLPPSYLSLGYRDDFRELAKWRHSDAWKETKRDVPPYLSASFASPFFTNELAAGTDPATIGITCAPALQTVSPDTDGQDTLVWGVECNVANVEDEGFVLYYHTLADEFARRQNWLSVQIDVLQIHFSQTGKVRVYRCSDRSDLGNGAKWGLYEEYEIAGIGDILNRAGAFIFTPMPGHGLSIAHALHPQRLSAVNSDATAGTTRAHLVPWGAHLEAGPVRVAINPYQSHVLGYQVITYPLSGTYTDGSFDPGYYPSAAPDEVTASILPQGYGAAAATLLKVTEDAEWEAGTDKRGRVKLTLTVEADADLTGKSRHTPFVESYLVKWAPVHATRNTIPVEVSGKRLRHLEIVRDEHGKMEGRALIFFAPNGTGGEEDSIGWIVFRGDATFVVQVSQDGGATWQTVFGGLCDFSKGQMGWSQSGTHYTVQANLHDFWKRFEELHQSGSDAMDGLDVGTAANRVLHNGSFSPVQQAAIPAEVAAVHVPKSPDKKHWRFASKFGDDGSKMMDALLLLLRGQNTEWMIIFDWDAGRWYWEKKAHDTGTVWTMSPRTSTNPGLGIVRFTELGFEAEAPEANVVQVVGLSDTNVEKAEQVLAAPWYNGPSINDPTSVDYLGRTKAIKPMFAVLTDVAELTRMGKRIKAAVSHRRLKFVLTTPDYIPTLQPTSYASIQDSEGRELAKAWLKRKTTVVTADDCESAKLEFDTQWESEIKL